MVVVVVRAAVVAVVLGAGLWSAGSLLLWGGQVNAGRTGDHLWEATSSVGTRVRGLGVVLILAGVVGLGPFLWVAAAVSS